MNVQKNGATAERATAARSGQRGPTVHWQCVVPNCTSNSSIRRHSFPKNVIRSEQWLQAINNPNLDVLTSDELRNYRVCQLHFPVQTKYARLVRASQNSSVPVWGEIQLRCRQDIEHFPDLHVPLKHIRCTHI